MANHGAGTPAHHPIPRTVDDLTPAWLTQALAAVSPAGARVVRSRATDVGSGMGLLGSLHRLDLTWEGVEGPASVVAKLPAPGVHSRAVATALGMYPREVQFYRDLGPGTDLAVACHHTAIDERTHDFVVLLDDMSGALMIDQLAGCPVDRAAELLEALAALHARHWDEAGLEATPWLVRFGDSALADELGSAVRSCWPAVRERFGAGLDPAVVALGDDLADLIPDVARALSTPPVTLSHGDLRLDNVFFHAAGVRMCDWQLTGRARGMRDVAYFVTQSLTPAARDDHERDLVESYLARLGALGVAVPHADESWHDYRQGILLGFAYAVVAAGGLDQDDPRSAAIPRVMLERSSLAMIAHGCVRPER